MLNLLWAAENVTPSSPPPPIPEGSFGGMLVPLVLTFLVFYFLLIRPQHKKQKEHDALLTNIKRGDNVYTNAGILGTITGITEKIVTLEIADNVRIKILRNAIAGLDLPNQADKK